MEYGFDEFSALAKRAGLRGDVSELFGDYLASGVTWAMWAKCFRQYPRARFSNLRRLMRRAVEYGALPSRPAVTADGLFIWEADSGRVSVCKVTFSHHDKTWAGWSGRPVPDWEQQER